MNRFRVMCSLAAMCGLAMISSAAQDVVREGTGDRRETLDKMELSDFDQSLWSGLTDWTNGGPIDPTSTAGKVVLIYTWSSFLPTATQPMSVVNRLAERYGEQGLVVVGVHHDLGWEDAERVATQRRASFPIVRDAGNKLREALHVDQDPDFYVIDRAGRVRYADIETGSLERAVSTLIEEDAQAATTLLTRMAEEEAQRAEESRRTQRLRSQIDLSSLPWVPFPEPGEDAYDAADWPKAQEDEDDRRSRRRNEPSGPVRLDLDNELEWHPGFPEQTEGRARLIYFFTPDIIADAARGGYNAVRLFQEMDRLQAAHARDLLVVGVMVPENGGQTRSRRRGDDDSMSSDEAAEKFRTITRQIPVNHVRVNDIGQQVVSGRISPDNGDLGRGRGRTDGFVLPYHVLVSSDNVVRWHGAIWTSAERNAAWEAALDRVLRVDPGVQARREAEAAYIRGLSE